MHCKATKVLGSRMQHGNANEMLGLSDAMKTTPSPQRRARRKGNKMLGRSDATKTTRSPQQRAHCRATKFIDPSLPRDAILSLYWFYWLRTLYVIQWQYVTCYTATLTNEISVAARYTSWWNEFRSIMLLLLCSLFEVIWLKVNLRWSYVEGFKSGELSST